MTAEESWFIYKNSTRYYTLELYTYTFIMCVCMGGGGGVHSPNIGIGRCSDLEGRHFFKQLSSLVS